MDAAEYARAVRIAQKACRGRRLSRDEWQQVEQDAAVALWSSGSVTRAWWAAVDSARKIQGVRRTYQAPVFVPFVWDGRAPVDVEAEAVSRVMVDGLLDRLPVLERMAVQACVLDGRSPQVVSREFGWWDTTVRRRRARGLARLREMVST